MLRTLPDVVEAAVVSRADPRWGEVPIAVVVPRPETRPTRAELLNAFEGLLARFKHPRDVLFVEALPRNVMGKVDLVALRALAASETTSASPPRVVAQQA